LGVKKRRAKKKDGTAPTGYWIDVVEAVQAGRRSRNIKSSIRSLDHLKDKKTSIVALSPIGIMNPDRTTIEQDGREQEK